MSRGWVTGTTIYTFGGIHRFLEIWFVTFLVLHIGITFSRYKLNWRRLLDGLREKNGTKIHSLRLVQRVSSWLIVIVALLVIIPGLSGYYVISLALGNVIPFSIHRIFDVILIVVIVVHVSVGIKFVTIRRRMKNRAVDLAIVGFAISLILIAGYLEIAPNLAPEDVPGVIITTVYVDPDHQVNGRVLIGNVSYRFDSDHVNTTRTDIFQPGEFSMFDVIVYVSEKGHIELNYEFNTTLNTHVIHSINGTEGWWYSAFYSGGWNEGNAYRMDHYHWKKDTTLSLYRISPSYVNRVHSSFVQERNRVIENNGSIIIPHVELIGRSFSYDFYNISIAPHNLRNDVFQEGVITGIDVIMTLGDLGLLNYTLLWYDAIGNADPVRNYWVESIEVDGTSPPCGWVYESGDLRFNRGTNHIHLPSDSRVMNSPEYVLWFWICV
ncbi:MAG: hypothetical protein ACXAEF_07825 [Candidatus Thorarchaeota archaeon]